MGYLDRHSDEPGADFNDPMQIPARRRAGDAAARRLAERYPTERQLRQRERRAERKRAEAERRALQGEITHVRGPQSISGRRVEWKLATSYEQAVAAGMPPWATASNSMTPKRIRVFIRDGWRCVECGTPAGLTIDHIRPTGKGGSRGDMRNLQTMCGPCNNKKGDAWDGTAGWPPKEGA